MSKVILYPTGYDLNALSQDGRYEVSSPTNGPAAGNYIVDVIRSPRSSRGDQEFIQIAYHKTTGVLYTRAVDGGVYSAWTEVGSGGGGGGGSYPTVLVAYEDNAIPTGSQNEFTFSSFLVYRITDGADSVFTKDDPQDGFIRLSPGLYRISAYNFRANEDAEVGVLARDEFNSTSGYAVIFNVTAFNPTTPTPVFFEAVGPDQTTGVAPYITTTFSGTGEFYAYMVIEKMPDFGENLEV